MSFLVVYDIPMNGRAEHSGEVLWAYPQFLLSCFDGYG